MDGSADDDTRAPAPPKTRSGFVLLGAVVVLGAAATALGAGRPGATEAAVSIALVGLAILTVAQVVLARRARIATIGLQFATVAAAARWSARTPPPGSSSPCTTAPSGELVLLASLLAATVAMGCGPPTWSGWPWATTWT
jgi:hypothetical protein